MASSELPALPAATTLAATDLFYTVTDPGGGAEADNKIEADDVAAALGLLIPYAGYTPTISQNGARTATITLARYRQVGKQVHAYGKAIITNAGTAGNAVTMSLPVNMHASINSIDYTLGTGVVSDSGTIWMPALVVAGISASTVAWTKTNGDAQAYIGVTPSFAVANTDYVTWNITYEAA